MINSTQFGEIIIDNKKYYQVLIIGDKIEERDYKKLKELFGTSHEIGNWEIEALISNNPEIIIIGTGQNGAMEVDEKTIKKFQDKGIETIIATTPKIIEIYNDQVKLGKRVNALIHTTC
ncbi:MAG: MTH938/NDUFAF3 family protein [Candidatus Omnitrophota bacterium]|nr:MTH938/NDUFAF3 family protein [Candidatus Omnitrophota bacterium]